jgi:hypothetical protein
LRYGKKDEDACSGEEVRKLARGDEGLLFSRWDWPAYSR